MIEDVINVVCQMERRIWGGSRRNKKRAYFHLRLDLFEALIKIF
jgi:hypothetical protein